MIEYKSAKVIDIYSLDENVDEVILDIEHNCKKAYNYKKMTGSVDIGDRVLVNTTACSLKLGTGGYHFIIANLDNLEKQMNNWGHGMKLKYTPQQVHISFCEEKDSPYHSLFQNTLKLKGKIVYIGELHSMLPPLCAYLKYNKRNIKICCIITDHGALPVFFSKNIRNLKFLGLLDKTISIGNAYGGDYECVNIYTGLQMAIDILKADITIITMGPGIMGTSTPFGFSSLEMGFYINFIKNKGGEVLYIPRISFEDPRERHYGISHHTLNVLSYIVDVPIPIVLPIMEKNKVKFVMKQLKDYGLVNRYPVIFRSGRAIVNSLRYFNLNPDTMGRGLREERDFFYALGAVGKYGLSLSTNLS